MRSYRNTHRPDQVGLRHEWRMLDIALGDLFVELGLALLQIGGRSRLPRMQFRAGRALITAAIHYHRAGLGRRARAVERLIELCRRAWQRHEAGEGFAA